MKSTSRLIVTFLILLTGCGANVRYSDGLLEFQMPLKPASATAE